MSHPLEWALWHLGQAPRRVLATDGTASLARIAPGPLPSGDPDRQVAAQVLRGSAFQPFDGDPLSGWHHVTLGFDARAEPWPRSRPDDEAPDGWCHRVLGAIRDNLLAFNAGATVPVTHDGVAVVSVGCSFEVAWIGRDKSDRDLFHVELPMTYALTGAS